MATQRFDPETKVNVKSLTIRIPPLPTDNKDKMFLLRVMVIERIRSYLESIDFHHLKEEILKKHIKIPEHYKTDEQQRYYFESETLEINSLFSRLESDPLFKEDFLSLKPFQGHKWQLHHSTEHAILLIIEV